MNITITAPPALSGDAQKDIVTLNRWCTSFYTNLKRALYTLDAASVCGTLSLGDTKILGDTISISNDGFSVASKSGASYLKFENGTLTFKGTVIDNG